MSTTTARPKADPQEILRALDVLFPRGAVVELRAFKSRRCTLSGYYDDHDRLAADAAKVNQRAGAVYVTLNEIDPALLARRANRFEEYADTTTNDDQVVRRRWLPVDLDADRPAGISSTDTEHDAAIQRARDVRTWLVKEQGWPEPVPADSGNGGHLLFRVDLSNDDEAADLAQRCLEALDARFSDAAVHIDTAVFNPSRIWKLYGTVAGKGDHTETRPHRLAKLLHVPSPVEPVPVEKLRELAALAPQPEPTPGGNGRAPHGRDGRLDVPAYLRQHGIGVLHDEPYRCSRGSGHRYVLERCVWNPDHTDKAVFVIQWDNGAIAAGCQHNSCKGKGWHDFRDTVEPGWRERRGNGRPRAMASPRRSKSAITTKTLADAIYKDNYFARDVGGKLYRYVGGVYKRRAEEYVRGRVKRLCIDWNEPARWSVHLAKEVVEFIRVDAPELWECPPLDVVNVKNGLVRVDNQKLLPHTSDHLSPVQLPIVFDLDAKCPAIEQFVEQVFPADARQLAWEVSAWLMRPDTSIQKAVLLTGEGANGKSTWLNLLREFLGKPSTSAVSLHKLERDQFAAARLLGKLANICPDLPSEHLEGTSVFKALTGGDTLTAEYKFRDSFDFDPFCRLVFSANHPPRSSDGSHAFFRRWLVIPFGRTFSEEEQMPRDELDAKLTAPAELSGMLNRALAALESLAVHGGFSEPESVREAWQDFHATTDPLAVWLDRYTVDEPGASVPVRLLRAEYNTHGQREGLPGVSKTSFGLAVKRLRPDIDVKQRTYAGRLQWCYIGLGLTRPEEGKPIT